MRKNKEKRKRQCKFKYEFYKRGKEEKDRQWVRRRQQEKRDK